MNYPLPRLKRDNFLFIIIRMAGNKRNNQVYNSSYYLKCLHRDFSLTTQKGIKNKRYISCAKVILLFDSAMDVPKIFSALCTAFSFKKYCSSLVVVIKILIFVRSDAEAPPQVFLLIVHFYFFIGGIQQWYDVSIVFRLCFCDSKNTIYFPDIQLFTHNTTKEETP